MRNPWADLPTEPPHVLADDLDLINGHNERIEPEYFVHTHLLPEPFLGRPDAPVVLLNLNPGYSEHDAADHAAPERHHLITSCLNHTLTDYPFYHLSPTFDPSGGFSWWTTKLRPVLERVDQQTVANRLLCVEWFGYKSQKFRQPRAMLPSQNYGFHLVRQAIKRKALVVLMRSRRLWTQSLPELCTYERVYALNSSLNVTVSQRNCPHFDEVVRELSF